MNKIETFLKVMVKKMSMIFKKFLKNDSSIKKKLDFLRIIRYKERTFLRMDGRVVEGARLESVFRSKA